MQQFAWAVTHVAQGMSHADLEALQSCSPWRLTNLGCCSTAV